MKKWVIPFIKLHYKGLLLSMLLGLVALASGALLMFTSGYRISKAALRPENILMIYVPIVAVRTFGIARSVIQYLARLMSHHTILTILSSMRNKMYSILEPQAAFIHSRFKIGRMLGVLSDDIDHLQDVFVRTVLPSVVALGMYGVAIFSLGIFDTSFALFMGAYLFVLVVLIPVISLLWNRLKMKTIKQKRNRRDNAVNIQFSTVYFKYENSNNWALEDINLDIPQGKKIALLGRSGAGKSTLLHLTIGLYEPSQGSVTLNNIPSHHYGDELYKFISVLNQKPYLFNTTIANNIRLGNQYATNQQLIGAAKQVNMHDFIMSLPKGYETPMNETGHIFSGGQRQRIALARILLKDSPVVILDEPTVGLDAEIEAELLKTIFLTLQHKTIIWVTHHLLGVNKVDEVVFLENGKIEMMGSHSHLFNNYPRYRNLYHLDVPATLKKTI